MRFFLLRPLRRQRTAGFTLLELMISIALVLVIILGVNQVFSLTSQTVGAGHAFTEINRDSRSVQTVVYNDLKGAAIDDGPFFIIRSDAIRAWRNKQDQDSDADGDIKSINGITLNPIPIWALTDHTHRVDRIAFFSRDQFRRQTGNNGTFAADQGSNEAYVSYGHLRRWNNAATGGGGRPDTLNDFNNNTDPGAGNFANNPNNFYASQWVLGRVAMLMSDPQLVSGNKIIYDRGGNAQRYYALPPNMPQGGYPPFSENMRDDQGTYYLRQTRYDLIGGGIDTARQLYVNANSTVISNGTPPVTNLSTQQPAYWLGPVNFRYAGELSPPRPIDSEFSAWTVPAFVPGCTQFCVEYAGDFCTQDVNGNIQPNTDPGVTADMQFVKPDGQIDFVLQNGIRKVRWYGFPRDTNDDGVVNNLDVLPFSVSTGQNAPARWERFIVNAANAESGSYLAAWGPDTQGMPRPKMIRITMTIDDPRASGARIAGGHTFEYVIELK